MLSSHTSLAAAADQRKARLAALKANSLKRKAPQISDDAPQKEPSGDPNSSHTNDNENDAQISRRQEQEREKEEEDVKIKYLSGRNYDIETDGPKLGFNGPPTAHLAPGERTLEDRAAEVEAELRAAQQKEEEEQKKETGVDLFKLQPKKPNWDLKRDLDKKLEILNVRTDNAIAQLVRERISGAKQNEIKAPGKDADGDEIGMQGVDLVEGARLREEEDKRDAEREDEEMS